MSDPEGERMKRDPELAESNDRFLRLVQDLRAIVWEAEANTWQFTFVSEYAELLLGYPLERWLREPDFWRVYTHPDDVAKLAATCQEATALGRPHTVEYRVLATDGRVVWVRDVVHVVLDEQGRPDQLRGVMVDVTDEKLLEERLRAQYQHLPVPAYTWQRQGDDLVLVDYNAAGLEITRGGIASLVGITARALYPDLPEVLADFTRCLEERTSFEREMRYRFRTTGETRWLVITYAYAPPDLVLVYTEDVTARKEAERHREMLAETEKLRALGQMASGVAHDLNQSLGLIAGHSDIALTALDGPIPDLTSARESLLSMAQAALDGAETVRRLQTFARPQLETPAEPVDLGRLLRDVAELSAPRWRDAAQAEGRSIRVELATEGELIVLGWPERLREALLNLVLNAVDALPDGGAICLAAHPRAARVQVEVADSGIGMSSDIQAHIFEPFFTTKGPRGTGLGLAMVSSIVERHGGQVEVDSAPGQGTTFRLSFPAAPAGATTRPLAAVEPHSRPLRILVVDDQPALGELLCRMLGLAGHQVAAATSGAQALERLRQEPCELLISDVGMPGMSGWELVETVRREYPDLPVVLATGWGAMIDEETARMRGIRAVVAKPYRIADLKRAIAEAAASMPPVPS